MQVFSNIFGSEKLDELFPNESYLEASKQEILAAIERDVWILDESAEPTDKDDRDTLVDEVLRALLPVKLAIEEMVPTFPPAEAKSETIRNKIAELQQKQDEIEAQLAAQRESDDTTAKLAKQLESIDNKLNTQQKNLRGNAIQLKLVKLLEDMLSSLLVNGPTTTWRCLEHVNNFFPQPTRFLWTDVWWKQKYCLNELKTYQRLTRTSPT